MSDEDTRKLHESMRQLLEHSQELATKIVELTTQLNHSRTETHGALDDGDMMHDRLQECFGKAAKWDAIEAVLIGCGVLKPKHELERRKRPHIPVPHVVSHKRP